MITKDNSSLVVVGSGIKFLSHLTTEAKAYIEQSDKVLYLVNDPVMKDWISKSNPRSKSLDDIYYQHELRIDSYQAITNCIIETLRENLHLCVVLYGHPTVFAKPALDAVIQAKKEGYYAKILPGISAEDCLFADLLIDPGVYGCQSYEATDFLIYNRKIDPTSHLILWQIGVIGALKHGKTHNNSKGTRLLFNYLKMFYQNTHQITIYEAAQYPGLEPNIKTILLEEIITTTFSRTSTLYIPPAYKAKCNNEMLLALGIGNENLHKLISEN